MRITAARAHSHQVGPDPGGDEIALLVEMTRYRTRRLKPREGQAGALDQVESERHAHRALDGGAADLAVALRGVGIANREQRAGDLDREIERGPGGEVADVHVAADPPGRDDAVRPGLSGRHPDRAAERLERHPRSGTVGGRREAPSVVAPDMERRVGELVGQEPESRDEGGPSPAHRRERFDRNLEGVARLGPVDIDRAGDRVDLGEIERADVGDGRVLAQLTAGCLDHLELDRVAGRHRQHRLVGVVPAEVVARGVDGVTRATRHRWRRRSRSGPECGSGRRRRCPLPRSGASAWRSAPR